MFGRILDQVREMSLHPTRLIIWFVREVVEVPMIIQAGLVEGAIAQAVSQEAISLA
jgi:hypothetical protein